MVKKKKKSNMHKFIDGISMAFAIAITLSCLVVVLASIYLFGTALMIKDWLTCIYICSGWIVLSGILNVIVGD